MLSRQQLAERCLEAREAAGLSREDLIAMLAEAGHSLAHQTMMRWELAKRDVPAWYLRALIDVLGTDPSWLLGSEASPAYAKLAAVREKLQEVCDILDAPTTMGAAADEFAEISAVLDTVEQGPSSPMQDRRRTKQRG